MRRTDLIALVAVFTCGACATDDLPFSGNRAPFANAGMDREVAVGDAVELDASESADPEDHELTFRWQLLPPEGSAALLDSTNNVTTGFVPDVPGLYEVTLIATDGRLDSPPDTVRITATGDGPNTAPLAAIDAPVSGPVGERVQLDGTMSEDPDGDSLFYSWLLERVPEGSATALTDPSSPTPSFTPDVAGDYSIGLVVNDGSVDSEPIVIHFAATGSANTAPVADAGRDLSVATNDTVTLDASESSDPDGTALSYIWSIIDRPQGSTASLSAADIANPQLTPDVDGDYRIQLVVSDGELQSEPDVATVTAVTGNVPPNAHAGSNQKAELGDLVSLDGRGSDDSEGDSLTYAWTFVTKPSGSSTQLEDAFTARPTFIPDAAGLYEVQLVVNDGTADSAPDTAEIEVVSPNVPPVADAGDDISGRVGDSMILDGTASVDPDGGSVTYAWTISFKPSSSQALLDDENQAVAEFTPDMPGTYSLVLTVDDGEVADSDMMTVTVLDPWPAREGDVVISEIMYDPMALSDSAGEWFEIYNPTNIDWNLSDCVLEDLGSDAHTIAASLRVPAKSYVTLSRSANPGFGSDYVYGGGFQLANGDDEIIVSCDGKEIANVAYDNSFPSAPEGHSISVLRNSLDETDNDDGANWCQSSNDYNGDYGTPGAPNESQNACQ